MRSARWPQTVGTMSSNRRRRARLPRRPHRLQRHLQARSLPRSGDAESGVVGRGVGRHAKPIDRRAVGMV